jgi:hypothetical protein
MRRHLLVLAFAIAAGLAAPAPAADPAGGKIVLLRGNESRVEVGADGRVLAVQSDPALPAVVADALAANIRKIAFAPPVKDGKAVPGVTFVWQDACAAPADGGAYRLAVRLTGNGPSLKQRYAPRYPVDALRAREAATWRVEYDVAPDGSVALHAATRTSGGRRFNDQFTQVIKSWVEAQDFIPEQLAGEPVGTRITTEVEFTFAERALKRRQAPEANASCQTALAAPLAKDRRVAMDSPFHPTALD